MIQRFNREQAIFGGLSIGAGVVILFIIWVVIRGALEAIMAFALWSNTTPGKFASLAMAVLIGMGVFRWWRAGERYRVFKDELFLSGLRREEGDDSGPLTAGDEDRIVGFADLFAQIFFGGPRLICTGITRIQSRLKADLDLEKRMRSVLEKMRVIDHWEPAMNYRDQAEEVGALIRCGFVDFSLTKMRLKAVPAVSGVSSANGDEAAGD